MGARGEYGKHKRAGVAVLKEARLGARGEEKSDMKNRQEMNVWI